MLRKLTITINMKGQSLRVLPPVLSRQLFISITTQAPISIVWALYSKLYVYCIIDVFVWLCGMNYWRDPRYNSRRRMVDIGAILIVASYHLGGQIIIRNWMSLLYCHILLLALGSYWKARKTRIQSQSIKWHIGLHFFGTLSNIIAYINLRKNCKNDFVLL